MLKKNATFQPYPNSIHDVVNNKSRIRLNIKKMARPSLGIGLF
jgi:hypothetical protein